MTKKFTNHSIKTVLTICVGLLVIFFVTHRNEFLIIASLLIITAYISKSFTSIINRIWMKLSLILSQIFPPILLIIIFFTFLTPIAILSRIFGEKNPLRLKNINKSLFKTVNKTFEKNSFEKPW
jgi:hypothetical protein